MNLADSQKKRVRMACVSGKNTFIPHPLQSSLSLDRLGYSRQEIKTFCSGTYSIETSFLCKPTKFIYYQALYLYKFLDL